MKLKKQSGFSKKLKKAKAEKSREKRGKAID